MDRLEIVTNIFTDKTIFVFKINDLTTACGYIAAESKNERKGNVVVRGSRGLALAVCDSVSGS